MKVTRIEVHYPTESVTIIPKKADDLARERMQFWNRGKEVADHYRIVTKVNQPQTIYVKQVARMVEEEFMTTDDYSIEQTGMTASAYQAKFGRAFNE